MEDSDCIVVMGSNMAENHPVAFRWPMKAKVNHGAKIIHVDPRFTRTSAVADIYAPVRAGSDIAFPGGLVRHVVESERWNSDPFFRSWVVTYTNAATIVDEAFRDAEDNDGVFSGLMDYTGGVPEWPYNGFARQYNGESWQYAGTRVGDQGRVANTAQSGETPGTVSGTKTGQAAQPPGPPFDALVKSLLKPAPRRDDTLQDPRCVFQIVKRHFSRYTPEMVEQVCGVPREAFLEVCSAWAANSGRDRTSALVYSVGWTQHTVGAQNIRAGAIVQLLLGNIGRPGGGVYALRGHANIQGSTDIPTLFDLLPGSLPMPRAEHAGLGSYLDRLRSRNQKGYWQGADAYLVSLLKEYFGAAATPENDFGFGWLPRINGDHGTYRTTMDMIDGRVFGYFVMGQNPAVGSAHRPPHAPRA